MSRCLLAATVVLASCGTPAAVAADHRSPGRVHDLPQPLPESSRASSTESRGPHTPTQGRSSMMASPTVAPPAHTTTSRANRGLPRPNLAALRQCESNGYRDKRNPKFRGAYQFDRSTWASVGGSGDPADASPAEQDLRALTLFQRSGRAPWRSCGSRL